MYLNHGAAMPGCVVVVSCGRLDGWLVDFWFGLRHLVLRCPKAPEDGRKLAQAVLVKMDCA